MKIGIIDIGISNIQSVYNSLKYLSYKADILVDSKLTNEYSHLILPGVGAYPKGIEFLKSTGFDQTLKTYIKSGKSLLGICLGMQLLSYKGEEHGENFGLNLVNGTVSKMIVPDSLLLPHVGWNTVHQFSNSKLWTEIDDETAFYFTHSFSYTNVEEKFEIGRVNYGGDVTVAIQNNNIYGVQFHPEKSQTKGLKLLKNFIELC
jgi:glutamine amidotransferase